MKKNVSGQKVGAQMVSAADGSAFAGAVTVYVTGDAGTQAVGAVGSGACAHEGNGYHTYAPAQAETNYDLVAFTFTGTGAIPQTVQVYTGFPQTGDAYAKGVDVEADTQDIQARLPAALVSGRIDASVGAMAANVMTAAAAAADLTTELQGGLATASALATLDGKADAIKAKTDNLPASPAATSDIPTATENADALLNRDMSAVSDTNARSPLNALRFLRNKWSLSGSTLSVTKENDTTTAWTATVSTDAAAEPVTGSDPA